MNNNEAYKLLRRFFNQAQVNRDGHNGLDRVFIPYGNGFGCYIYPTAFNLIPTHVVITNVNNTIANHRNINTYVI